MQWSEMDLKGQLNLFEATARAKTPPLHPQQLTQPTPRHQPVQHQHSHPQATLPPHQLVHQMSGVQQQGGEHIPVTPSSMPPFHSSFSPASGMSGPGLMPTPRHSHPRTPHPLQQQQGFNPPMPSNFPLMTGHEQSHPPLVAHQPIQQSFGVSRQPQYPHHQPGIPEMMPQWLQQPVQPQQQVRVLSPTQLPDAIQVIQKYECIGLFIYN